MERSYQERTFREDLTVGHGIDSPMKNDYNPYSLPHEEDPQKTLIP